MRTLCSDNVKCKIAIDHAKANVQSACFSRYRCITNAFAGTARLYIKQPQARRSQRRGLMGKLEPRCTQGGSDLENKANFDLLGNRCLHSCSSLWMEHYNK